MESQELMANFGISNGDFVYTNGNGLDKKHSENELLVGVGGDENEKGEIADVVLEGFEEYWEDINDRLTISRMVSDSVIKGMVNAVEQEAAEKIAVKEMELADLKERLRSREGFSGECGVKLPVTGKGYEVGSYERAPCVSDACVKHEKMREDLIALRNLTRERFEMAKKEVNFARGANSMKKIGSGSVLVGLGGILNEKHPESWMHVDKMLECLNTTVDDFCSKMDDMLLLSEASLCESQQDQDLLVKLEDIVMQSVIRSLREEHLLELNAQLTGIQTVNWLEKFNNISGLGTQLGAIQKSLSIHETGLLSHGSHDLDHLHHKAFSNHVTPPTSLHGENGAVDESCIHVAESYDFQQLRHMKKEELVDYFNNIITKIKRDHESVIQKNTEEYFRLKREFLKVRGSFVMHMKDEEFDVLRKKIPEIISKLEDFLQENERFPALNKNFESVENLKHRLDRLLFENHQLSDCLNDKKNEVKFLEAQVASANEAFLQRSRAEENMLKHVENLKTALEDSCIEASLSEEVYKSALREQIARSRRDSEDLNMEFLLTHEIYDTIIREASIPAETANRYEIEDSDIESWTMQGCNGLVFTEAMKDACRKINDLCQEALSDKEIRICLEATALEKENEYRQEFEESKKLKQKIADLLSTLQEKDKSTMDLSLSLSAEREQFELASQELSSLRQDASRQQTLLTESNRDLESLKAQHLEALEQIKVDKMEVHKLKQKLDQTKEVLTEANDERSKALAVAQEMHDKFLLSQAREETLKKEIKIAVNGLSNLFDDFESRVSGAIEKNILRFEDTSSHLKALKNVANDLRTRELMYKQKYDMKCVNLQKAETEVDLLGDEVDALLRLLDKIYIALDHYSPVLKHYPGIIEILELVRRELSGESTMLS